MPEPAFDAKLLALVIEKTREGLLHWCPWGPNDGPHRTYSVFLNNEQQLCIFGLSTSLRLYDSSGNLVHVIEWPSVAPQRLDLIAAIEAQQDSELDKVIQALWALPKEPKSRLPWWRRLFGDARPRPKRMEKC